MSTSQTVLEYIQALKWPVVVSGIAYTFRTAIGEFLKKLAESDEGSVKVAGMADVSWKNQVNALAKEVEQIEEQSAAVSPAPGDTAEHIEPDSPEAIEIVMKYSGLRDEAWEAIDRAVLTDPTGAIIGAWIKVEDTVFAIARDRLAYVELGRPTLQKMVETLPVADDLKVVIKNLRRLRNDAAHGQAAIDSDVALTYVQAAKRVVTTLSILFPG